ncbi:hypothetical protein WMY93_007098 [Mugilogobius chulae]|uniref:RING-type domain-containing protein n=1 Tax=Mugilogobius chulae TaxID=88201 RepID=A0AAW0PT00_9GOBI
MDEAGAESCRGLRSSTHGADTGATSGPNSPSSSPQTPSALGSGSSDPALTAEVSALRPTAALREMKRESRGREQMSHYSNLQGPQHFTVPVRTTPSSPISLPKSPTFPSGRSPWTDECSICYENLVDTVIYACGHMCLCYTCGVKLKKMSNACCPICRRQIKDIIKTYRST